MAKSTKKQQQQKYMVLFNDAYAEGSDIWDTDYIPGKQEEFNSVEEAMAAIKNLVNEDVKYYSSYGFKIVAVSNQVITVKTTSDFTLEVINEGE